jgi:hypothetical protein
MKKWAMRGLCMDFAILSMVYEVTARALPKELHVVRSSQRPLQMTLKKSSRRPRDIHFFEI